MRPSLVLILCSLAACGAPSDDDGGNLDPDAPIYVGATRVFGADDSSGYLFATNSLEAGTEVDLSRAIEMEDAWVFGPIDGAIFTATIFEPTITRWTLDEDGAFVEGPTVSFAGEGVTGTYIAAFTPLYADDKAYFVDSGSRQVVVWNPQDVTLLDTIPLELDEVDGMEPIMDLTVRDDRIFVTVFWTSADSQFTEYADHSQLIVIDPTTDTITSSTSNTRCQTMTGAGVSSDGTAWFSAWDMHPVVRHVFGGDYGAAACAARIVPSGASYDEGYDLDLSTLVGGKPAGSLRVLADDSMLMHVWDDTLTDATPEGWSEDRWAAGYEWYRWTPGEAEAVRLPEQEPTGEGGEWRILDGGTWTFGANAEYSETTMYRLTDEGTLEAGAVLPGWTVSVIRAR